MDMSGDAWHLEVVETELREARHAVQSELLIWLLQLLLCATKILSPHLSFPNIFKQRNIYRKNIDIQAIYYI